MSNNKFSAKKNFHIGKLHFRLFIYNVRNKPNLMYFGHTKDGWPTFKLGVLRLDWKMYRR